MFFVWIVIVSRYKGKSFSEDFVIRTQTDGRTDTHMKEGAKPGRGCKQQLCGRKHDFLAYAVSSTTWCRTWIGYAFLVGLVFRKIV